jgi:hypothetical protein
MAVGLREPALQLMTVLEANHDPELIPEVIRLLQKHTLSEVAARPMIQEPFRPLLERHQHNREVVRERRPSTGEWSSSTSRMRAWTR